MSISHKGMALQGTNPACAATVETSIKEATCATGINASEAALMTACVQVPSCEENPSGGADVGRIRPPVFSKEDFLSMEVYKWIMNQSTCEQEAEMFLYQLNDQAKKYKISGLRKGFKAYKETQQKRKTPPGNGTLFSQAPHGRSLFCGEFVADDYGVRVMDKTGRWVTVCWHPIQPVSRVRDVDKSIEQFKLWYEKDGEGRTVVVDAVDLASTQRVILLSNYGIDVNQTTASQFVKYINILCQEPNNRKKLPLEKGISRCGYIDDKNMEFAPYSDTCQFIGKPTQERLFNAIKHQGGDADKQLEFFNGIRKSAGTAVRIAIAASLASPLLKPLRLKPFVIYIMGGKDIGKSKVVSLAASIWGDPEVYVHNLGSTKVGCEMLASFLHSLPLCLDELMTNDNKQSLAQLIYMLCQGKGKTRANKNCDIRDTPEWYCSSIMSGERQPLSSTDWAGAEARTIILDAGNKPLFEDFAMLIRMMHTHYGWIGKKFVEILSKPGMMEKIAKLYDRYSKAFSDRGYQGKQAGSAAVCLVADTIASATIFQDADDSLRLTIDDMISYLAEPKETDMGLKMMRWLQGWIAENYNHFIRPAIDQCPDYFSVCKGEYIPTNKDIYGRITLDGYTSIMEKPLADAMYAAFGNGAHLTFAKWAGEQGLIQRENSSKRPFKNVHYPNRLQARSLVINFDKFNEEEDPQTPSTSEDALLNIFPAPNGDSEDKGEDSGQQLSMEGVDEHNDEGRKLSA